MSRIATRLVAALGLLALGVVLWGLTITGRAPEPEPKKLGALQGVTFVQRIADGTGTLAPQERAIAFPAGWTITDQPTASLVGSPGGPGQVTGYSQLVAPGGLDGGVLFLPQYQLLSPGAFPLTSSTPATLASLPVPAGTTVIASGTIIANLGPGGANADQIPQIYTFSAAVYRVASGGLNLPTPSFTSFNAPPFTSGGSGVAGSVGFAASGTTVLLQGQGFSVKEAWTSGHTYAAGNGTTTPGDFVTSSGNVYVCTTSGAASGSPPAGTGVGIVTGVAVWAYVNAGSAPQVTFTVTKIEVMQG